MRPKWLARAWPWVDRELEVVEDDADAQTEPLPAEMTEDPDGIADIGSDRDAWWNQE